MSGVMGGRIGARIVQTWMARYGKRGTYLRTGVAALGFGTLILLLFGIFPPSDPANRRWSVGLGGGFALLGAAYAVAGLRMKPVGQVDGLHYSAYARAVSRLQQRGSRSLKDSEALLLRLVDAAELEARTNDWPLASWPYEQLAKVYRIRDDPDRERSVLERYERHVGKRAPVPRMAKRLATLRGSNPRRESPNSGGA